MKSFITVVFFMLSASILVAQRQIDLPASGVVATRSSAITEDFTGRAELYKFYIPSAMLFAGLEPAATSKLNLDFADNKVEFKYGWEGSRNDPNTKNALVSSFGIKAKAAAPEGARTLFRYDNTPRDLSIGGVWTLVTSHAKEISGTSGAVTTYASRTANWFNLNLTYTNTKRVIFSDDINFSNKYYSNVEILVTFNHFKNAWHFTDDTKKRWIYSFGAGLGNYDNYDDLSDHTLRKGETDPSGQYFIESDDTSGKLGEYNRYTGFIFTTSLFKLVSEPDARVFLAPGLNFNSYGLFSNHPLLNANGGVYIGIRSVDTTTGEFEEDFSFAVLADFNDLNSAGNDKYFRENFQIVLSAQIPLRFR